MIFTKSLRLIPCISICYSLQPAYAVDAILPASVKKGLMRNWLRVDLKTSHLHYPVEIASNWSQFYSIRILHASSRNVISLLHYWPIKIKAWEMKTMEKKEGKRIETRAELIVWNFCVIACIWSEMEAFGGLKLNVLIQLRGERIRHISQRDDEGWWWMMILNQLL